MSDIKASRSRQPHLPSGRFVLRIDPRLHARLREAAARHGLSLNDYCARKLASPASPPGPASEVVARAATLLGDDLTGVVAFGSWARGQLAASSDVDVLIVVDRRTSITRDLYRRWDAAPVYWETHPVEPHFVHLPDPDARASAIWAEAAIDGIVLFDSDLSVSRWLVRVRRRIVDGQIVRRIAHGQPYWVEAA
ncbi:MAG: toxin-antitoxin system HicB family antitoxin [Armatimonadota bacterium]|nr:toxin-antitoxin system HicB family antitoxin [Armatimonadota bacterium]